MINYYNAYDEWRLDYPEEWDLEDEDEKEDVEDEEDEEDETD